MAHMIVKLWTPGVSIVSCAEGVAEWVLRVARSTAVAP